VTSTIPVSSALLKSLSQGRVYDADLARAYETGEAHTRRASSGPALSVSRLSSRFISRGTRKHPTSPDKEASRERKRSWAGSGMPRFMWRHYTEGERAVLCVVGDQVRKHGYCDLPIDRVAAVAGVSRTTVQNALRKARASELAHVTVEERPRAGRKNLTNIIRIISSAWLGWLKRCIGFKKVSPTVAKESRPSFNEPVARSQGAFETGGAGCEEPSIHPMNAPDGSVSVNTPLCTLPRRKTLSERLMNGAFYGSSCSAGAT